MLSLASCGRVEPFQARFAVRGRWGWKEDERINARGIPYRVEAVDSPLAPEVVERAIEGALETWGDTGCVRFHWALEWETPEIVFAWRRGAHDSCPPFGIDSSVAHTGPVGPGTFVHFDAAREWSERGEHGFSLRHTALHEVGHALGLDHSPDGASVMSADSSGKQDELGRSDVDAIRSLYEVGCPPALGAGDIAIANESCGIHLCEVAPRELCDWTPFDTDGDGSEEILVWRTDVAGSGALWIFHFAHWDLDRTLGPFYGTIAPGSTVDGFVDEQGRRLLVFVPPGGPAQACEFVPGGELRLLDDVPAHRLTSRPPTFELGSGPERVQVWRVE